MLGRTLTISGLVFMGLINFGPHDQKTASYKAPQITLNPTNILSITPNPIIAPTAPIKATQPTPFPAPPKVPVLASCETYRSLVNQYSWNTSTIMAIMRAESGCRADAISPPNYDGVRDFGLFQIHGEAIMDPAANIARAHGKYITQGLRAWSVYNNGSYLKYLR